MKTIKRSELIERLKQTDASASFVSIESETEPRMRKTDNPFFGSVTKMSEVRGIINFHYANAVNNQREREGVEEMFEAQPRVWGERIDKTPLVKHKGSFYIEMKVEDVKDSKFVDNDGNEVSRDKLKPFLYENKKPSTQGTEKIIFIRDYKVDSIKKIRMYGEEYVIVED